MQHGKKILLALILLMTGITIRLAGQTPIPNNSFEDWTSYGNYSNPNFWDTPNQELTAIPFFGSEVVTRSTDHYGTGTYSVRLESKHIILPPLDAPGFITLGKLTLDIITMSFTISGGAPIFDQPTHLKGFYKYLPLGGDSTLIGIGLFKTDSAVKDTIASGYFTTKIAAPDWTPFYAWISYDTLVQPDTMNIIAFSTAQETFTTPGTVLYLDELALDYTTGTDDRDPAAGVDLYNDRETNRLMVFYNFPVPENISVSLYNMMGQQVFFDAPGAMKAGRTIIPYDRLKTGIYILELIRPDKKLCRKYFLNP